MIEIKNLSKIYKQDVHALDNVSLSIEKGMFGLLGPNGAGKTTLMRILVGLLKPSQGKVFFEGRDLDDDKARQYLHENIGYLPQEVGVNPHLTAREFLNYIGTLKGLTNRTQREQQVQDLLERVHLEDVASRRLSTFSGGMKRRIGIAQALLNNPKLLVIDEPTTGLDPEERLNIRNTLSKMAANITILLSTHIIEDIAHTSTEIAILNHGTIVFLGKKQTLLQDVRDKVWLVHTDKELPQGDYFTVSVIHDESKQTYRIVGQPPPGSAAEQVDPVLEDGYIWLIKQSSQAN